MRAIPAGEIVDVVADLCRKANFELRDDMRVALEEGARRERYGPAREVLDLILENAEVASRETIPICQDTGVAVVLVKKGEDVPVKGGSLGAAIEQGVRRGYTEGCLRKSIVSDPLERVNTGDNTPPIVVVDEVPGEKIELLFMAKGGGCENAGALRMLKPADGEEGVVRFVVDTVRSAGAAACPPFVIGVGLGGTMDKAAQLAKKALFREVGSSATSDTARALEARLLKEVNATGIGPAGLGGDTTALAVHVETHPCHIASLPVAVNIDCHAHRIASAEL